MNATELTFGIEIETTVDVQTAAANLLQVGSYYSGIQVPYLPAGWEAKSDGSIQSPNGHMGCEIVSPILRGAEGLAQAVEVVKILEAKGHKVNASCGVHVHIGWNRCWPSQSLARLITYVACVEKGLYAITGTKNRERGHFCGGVRKYGNATEAKKNMDYSRYHALNVANLANGRKSTVEFRVFSGSLNPVKIAGWIQVCLGLVEKALNGKKNAPWNPKRKPTAANKIGQLETFRLSIFLGWVENEKHHYGWMSETISRRDVLNAFNRLAKKYDEMV